MLAITLSGLQGTPSGPGGASDRNPGGISPGGSPNHSCKMSRSRGRVDREGHLINSGPGWALVLTDYQAEVFIVAA